MKRLILIAAVAAVCIVLCGGRAMAGEVINYSRITRSLNGTPENPALPLRTKVGQDGKIYGEYPGTSGTTAWKDISRQPYFVMPLRSDLNWYTSDGRTGTATHSRSSTAYYRNRYGQWTQAGVNEPRYGFENMSTAGDGYNWTSCGYLGEDTVANLALQSDTPSTQTVSIATTGYYTLWVDGTGSCTVAANTAAITGGGTATGSAWVTFNCTAAGTVNLTVSGSLSRFQLEKWYWPTSYIPTTTVAVTRAADVLTVPSAGLIDDSRGSVATDYVPLANGASVSGFNKNFMLVDGGGGSAGTWLYMRSYENLMKISDGTTVSTHAMTTSLKVLTLALTWNTSSSTLYNKTAGTYAPGTYDGSWNWGASMYIGRIGNLNGHLTNLRVWKGTRLRHSEVAAL